MIIIQMRQGGQNSMTVEEIKKAVQPIAKKYGVERVYLLS